MHQKTFANNISFISHLKIDNELRKKNLKVVSNFYYSYMPEAEFVFVLEQEEDSFFDIFEFLPKNINCKLITTFVKKDEPIKKSKSYNIGATHAKNDILIFLDIDVIVNPNIFLPELYKIYTNNNLNFHVGYNGIALYMTERGESNFINSNNIKDLESTWSNKQLFVNSSTEDYLCGNTKAVGGFLITTKQSFFEINGFNPFIIGWGFEDNEIVTRAHKLNKLVTKSNNLNSVLYHLPHSIDDIDKSSHTFYKNNFDIHNKILNSTKDEISEYIKTW